ncbi:hypothetical protein [Bacillus infantis]|uniref:hypothetical protein n=1 Tax=Bacillus infantis TaxID=324767 RepID=UPI003CE8D89C
MNVDQLERGNKLLKVIEVTKDALVNLKELSHKNSSKENNIYDLVDGHYNLTIAEHRDGSGIKGVLNRSVGNAKLLDVIIKELEQQLIDFEEEFKSL